MEGSSILSTTVMVDNHCNNCYSNNAIGDNNNNADPSLGDEYKEINVGVIQR